VLLLLQKVFLRQEQLSAWGWRIPFVIGALISVYPYYMRRDMHESHLFREAQKTLKSENLWTALGAQLEDNGGCRYYDRRHLGLTRPICRSFSNGPSVLATTVSAGSLIVAIILQPLYGALSDKVCRKPMLIASGGLGTLGTCPLLTTLQETKIHRSPFF
jgi:MFS transporter, MHS family, alpha-ketoglutarate permease